MPDSGYFVWAPPGTDVRIEVSLAVIDRLRSILEESPLYSGPDGPPRMTEIGGLLIGKRPTSGTLEINDFELIRSEHRRGASFTLSPADRSNLAHRHLSIVKRGRTVVGYFRTHTRTGLYLDHADDLLVRQFFSEPWQVMLLARPGAKGQVPTAGFFYWDAGEVDRRRTRLEFPFDRTALEAGHYPIVHTRPAAERVLPAVVEKEPVRARQDWMRIAGAVGIFALTAVFVPAAVFTATDFWDRLHKNQRPVRVQASTRADVTRESTPAASPLPPPVVKGEEQAAETKAEVSPRARPARRAPRTTPKEEIAAPVPERQTAVGPPPPPPPEQIAAVARSTANAPAPVSVPVKPILPPLRPEVTLEPVHHSALHKTLSRIPLISKLERDRYQQKEDFVPARPLRETAPTVPPDISSELERDQPVDVRVRISKDGAVSAAEVVSRNSDPKLANIAVRAASDWDFEPARVKDKAVPSEIIVHFRFRATRD